MNDLSSLNDSVQGQLHTLTRLWILLKVLTNSLCFDKSIGKKVKEREVQHAVKGFDKVWKDEILSCLGIYFEGG